MDSLNLLPWRHTHQQYLLRHFAWQSLIVILFSAVSYFVAQYQLSNWQNNLIAQQNQLNQSQLHNQQLQNQITQLRQKMPLQTQLPLNAKHVQAALVLLNQLPFTQGELHDFLLNAEQMQLIGLAQNQAEFEAIHQFLIQQFSQVNLIEFQSDSEKWHFHFELNGEKNRNESP